jgi:hypothetical protein
VKEAEALGHIFLWCFGITLMMFGGLVGFWCGLAFLAWTCSRY